jgi:4-hydroxy-tetrahydrodipicolinate synthase
MTNKNQIDGKAGPFRGAMTAIVTPYEPEGQIDHQALAALTRWQVESGINGIVPAGTTGEGATMTDDEHRAVVETVVRAAAGKVPVIAGCGTNDTRRTVEAACRVAEAGADALLVVTPYYNKPNRSGMIAHYRKVAEATSLPVVVYNVPGRTAQNLGADLILELATIPGVVAVKEASGSLDQIGAILAGRPSGPSVLSGDDSLCLPTLALGADGIISVVGNEAPGDLSRMVQAALNGDLDTAREIHYRLLPLMNANFIETNPVPVKTALSILGRCGGLLRAPLGPPQESTVDSLHQALRHAGLLEAVR